MRSGVLEPFQQPGSWNLRRQGLPRHHYGKRLLLY